MIPKITSKGHSNRGAALRPIPPTAFGEFGNPFVRSKVAAEVLSSFHIGPKLSFGTILCLTELDQRQCCVGLY